MKRILVLTAFSLILVVGCGGNRAKKSVEGRTIQVVTTTGMIGDVAAAVGGERAEVKSMMGPGVDPHLYQASAGDVELMRSADLIFYNGLHLEGRMTEIFAQMQSFVMTVAVAENTDHHSLIIVADDGEMKQHDPHIWFDVALWKETINAIEKAYVELDPKHEELYHANAKEYRIELEALDRWVAERTAEVPENKRVLITAHDAFGYFARAYGFEVHGLQGISTSTEAGTGDVIKLAGFIAEKRIPAIFVESSVTPRTIEAVQAAVRSRGFEVVIGGELFSDAMGNAGTPEGTYVGMVRHNVNTIVDALR